MTTIPDADWQPTDWLALERAIQSLGYEAAEVSLRSFTTPYVRHVVRVIRFMGHYSASGKTLPIALQRAWQTALHYHATEGRRAKTS